MQHYVVPAVYFAKLMAAIDASNNLKQASPVSKDVLDKGFTPLENLMPIAVGRNMAILLMAVLQLIVSIVLMKNIAQALGAENQLYGLSRMV